MSISFKDRSVVRPKEAKQTALRDEGDGATPSSVRRAGPLASGPVRRGLYGGLLAFALALTVVLVAPAPSAHAGTMKLSGEVNCTPNAPLQKIWFLGSQSGWHGYDVPKAKQKYSYTRYSFNAVKGETVQVWQKCKYWGERYTTFKVGSGTRHICITTPCVSTKVGGCVLKAVLTGPTGMALTGCALST